MFIKIVILSVSILGFIFSDVRCSESWHRPRLRRSSVDGISELSGDNGRAAFQENQKPVFVNCTNYRPSVLEEQPPGTVVFTVAAVDNDPPENGGTVEYTFVTTPREKQKFTINQHTGVITTAVQFDRDEPSREKEVFVTVRATDNGRPSLDDLCTIRISIEDINDNAPIFDKVTYKELVPQDLMVDREVMRVSATDVDDGNNSVVKYQIRNDGDDSYFRIDEDTGVIFLRKQIDKLPGYTFKLTATVRDLGNPSLSNSIGLEVEVIESNKKLPSFIDPPIHPIHLKESYNDFDAHIVAIKAESNIPENNELLFDLVRGNTEASNSLLTFVFETVADTIFIKLGVGKNLDYESIIEYTLTVRVKNKYELAAEIQVHIVLEDVNDNAPYIPEGITGNILENEPPGTVVMQVQGIDLDGTSANNIVSYALADHLDLFSIDPTTGIITSRVSFDREEKDFYNVKVIVTDNSPSSFSSTGKPNSGERVFRIQIADKNDNPPHFTQDVYVAESIAEDANINALVTEVKALDNDTASAMTYTIINGNTYDAFLIEHNTGRIRVKNQLDYENITQYTLVIRAFDGIYEDTAKVEIKIENVNDNPPVFVNTDKIMVTINEEERVEGCIAKVEAYDPDIKDRNAPQGIVYSIVKEEQKKLLSIDNDGCLRIIEPLDRDPPNGFPSWQVNILAMDENGTRTGLRATTEVIIILIDINDNAPFINNTQPVVWYENQLPGFIVQLTADDNDAEGNRGPFQFALDSSASSDIQSKFNIQGDNLNALVTFDREEIKEYFIPIAVTDSGTPNTMTGVSSLHVIIGDINDNPMQPGSSNIFVYNYMGKSPDTDIGRVFVEDPDDWDLPDKVFQWRGGKPDFFGLNSDTGVITMKTGISNGTHQLFFTVTEESRNVARHSVDANVTVTVKEIPEEAVDKSGSMRLFGITAEEFVKDGQLGQPSKKDQLHTKIVQLLGASPENVDLFTVLHHDANTSLLDVRFSAHGSPYYAPEKINGIISQHQAELETELGLQVFMVNIDECLIEKQNCGSLSCTNNLTKSEIPSSVFTNRTSFVGVTAIVKAECVCEAPLQKICLNGGTLFDNYCECPAGYEGPHCELVSIGFNGDGWAMYPPLGSCESSTLAFEFSPQRDDSIVFYAGPLTFNPLLPVQDFISLELIGGFPVLIVDYGSGAVRVEHKHIKLTDGRKHRIAITLQKKLIDLVVDDCRLPSCESSGIPVGDNEILNVNGPLQIGGTAINIPQLALLFNWTYTPTEIGFAGCIQNLTFNKQTYNLGMPSLHQNADLGCQGTVAKAIGFGINTNFLIAILVCIAILLLLLLAVVVHRRKPVGMLEDDMDGRENIISYEDEGGGEKDTGYDLDVFKTLYDGLDPNDKMPLKEQMQRQEPGEGPDIYGIPYDPKDDFNDDLDIDTNDDFRHYAYEGDGDTSGSLSSLASRSEESDLEFDYLSEYGPQFTKLADMYGEDTEI